MSAERSAPSPGSSAAAGSHPSGADLPAEGVRQYRFSLPDGATDLLLVRHGESLPAHPDQPFPVLDGQGDPPLDPRGHREAELVAGRLAAQRIAAIYVSTLQRTQQTAAPLAARLDLQPTVDPDLREIHLGEWEGGVFRIRARQRHPLMREMYTTGRWDVIPGAERQEDFHRRIRAAITRIARAHRNERVVVVSHGGVIGTLVALATGAHPFAFIGVDNGSMTHLVVSDDHWTVRRVNDTGHLPTDLDAPPQPLE